MKAAVWVLVLTALAACGEDDVAGDGADARPGIDATVDQRPDAAPGSADAAVDSAVLGAPLSVHVAGTEVTAWSYGDHPVGTTAATTFTVTNDAALALTLAPALADDDDDFTIDEAATTCDDGPVDAGASCDVVVSFAPGSAGACSASLRLVIDDHYEVTVALTGTAIAPSTVLRFEPTHHAFGVVELGRAGTAAITVRNEGSIAVAMTAVEVGGRGFSRHSTTCGASLEAGASCQVVVRFAPAALGATSGTLSITTGAAIVGAGGSDDTAVASMTGTGAGRVTVSTTGAGAGTIVSVPAGIRCPGTCSALFSAPLRLSASAGPGDRLVRWSDPCGAGASCVITPGATPTTPSARFEDASSTARALTVIIEGGGLGVVAADSPSGGGACHGRCTFDIALGEQVTVFVTASSAYSGLSGSCAGASDSCSFTVDGDETVTAAIMASRDSVWSQRINLLDARLAFAGSGDLLIAAGTTVLRRSRTGAVLSTTTLPAFAGDVVGIDSDGAGNVFVLRHALGTLRLDKLSPAGTPLWNRRLDGFVLFDGDFKRRLSVNAAGVSVVSGNAITVLEASGELRWTRTEVGAQGAAIAGDGRVFVTVPSPEPGDSLRLVVYDAAGVGQSVAIDGIDGLRSTLDVNEQGVAAVASAGLSNARYASVDGTRYDADNGAASYGDAGVAVDGNGNMIAAYQRPGLDRSGYVLRVDSITGNHWMLEHVDNGLNGALVQDLAVDSSGRFAVLADVLGYGASYQYVEVFDPQ